MDKISGAANRMLGFLWRSLNRCPQPLKEKSYKAIVRPKLELAYRTAPEFGTHTSKNMWISWKWFSVGPNVVLQDSSKVYLDHRRTKPPAVSAVVSDLG